MIPSRKKHLSVPPLRLLFCMAAAVLLLFSPARAAGGMRDGVHLCMETVVPSLFPFMVLSEYIAVSGVGSWLGKKLQTPMQTLFSLPGDAAPVAVLAFLGGYPVGAAGCAQLLGQKRLTGAQADRLLALCCIPSPAFMICAVGEGMYGTPKAGAVLWCFCALGSLLPALFRGRRRSPAGALPPADCLQGTLSSAVAGASGKLFLLCGLVALFSAVRAFTDALLPADAALLCSLLLEVTGGIRDGVRRGLPLWAVAFAAGWGGLCVHLQIFSMFRRDDLHKGAFLRARLWQAVLSAAGTALFCRAFPQAVPVFSTAAGAFVEYLPAPGSFALLLLCAVFILCEKTTRPLCTPQRNSL